MATTVAASNYGFRYNRNLQEAADGTLWMMHQGSTGNITMYYSQNSGTSWSAAASGVTIGDATALGNTNWFLDVDDNIHIVYRDTSGFDYVFGSPNGTTDFSFQSAVTAWSGFQIPYGADVVAFPVGTGWKAFVIMGNYDNSAVAYEAWVTRMDITSGFSVSVDLAAWEIDNNTIGGSAPTNIYVSAHFTHTGDGKTPAPDGNVDIHYAMQGQNSSQAYIYKGRVNYNSGAWNTAVTPVAIENTSATMTGSNPQGRFICKDGFYAVMSPLNNTNIAFREGIDADTNHNFYDDDTNSPAALNSSTYSYSLAFTKNPDIYVGDLYLFSNKDTDNEIYYNYRDQANGSNGWGGWTSTSLGANVLASSSYPGMVWCTEFSSNIYVGWNDGASSPFTLKFGNPGLTWTSRTDEKPGSYVRIANYSNVSPTLVSNYSHFPAHPTPNNKVWIVGGQTDVASGGADPELWVSTDKGLTWNTMTTTPTCSVWDSAVDRMALSIDDAGNIYFAHTYDTSGRDVHIHKGVLNTAETDATWDNTNVIDAQSAGTGQSFGTCGMLLVSWEDSTGDNYVVCLKGETGSTSGRDLYWGGWHQTGGTGSWTTDRSWTTIRNTATFSVGGGLFGVLNHNNVSMMTPESDTPDISWAWSNETATTIHVGTVNTSAWTTSASAVASTTNYDEPGMVLHIPNMTTTPEILRTQHDSFTAANIDVVIPSLNDYDSQKMANEPNRGTGNVNAYYGLFYSINDDIVYEHFMGPNQFFWFQKGLVQTQSDYTGATAWTTDSDPSIPIYHDISSKDPSVPFVDEWGALPKFFRWTEQDGTFSIGVTNGKVFNSIPSATITSPDTDITLDVSSSLSIQWTYNDSEGDPQAYYTLRKVVDAVTTTYWNGSSWVGSEGASTKISGAATAVAIGKNWGSPATETSHAYSVKVWDDQNADPSGWSTAVTIYPISSESTVKGYSLPRPIKRQQDINATLRSNQDYSVSWINTYVPSYGDLNDDLYIKAGVRPGGTSYLRSALPAVVGSFDVGNGTNYYATLGATDVYRTNEYALSSEKAKRFRPKRLSNALEIIIGVDVFEYEYKERERNGAHESRWGLVVEDLNEKLREFGIKPKDSPLVHQEDGTWFLNEQQLIPLMWQAIQDLYDLVQDLIPPGQRKERKPIVSQERRVKNE